MIRPRLTLFVLLFVYLTASVGCDAISASDNQDETASEQPDEGSNPGGADEGQERDHPPEDLTLDGTDEEAFDESWQTINANLSEQNQLRFNVGILAATTAELEPEDDEVDTSNFPEALDGKTPEQIDVIAEEFIDGFIDFDDLTAEEAQKVYDEFGFDLEDELSISDVVDVIEAEFAPDEQPQADVQPDADPHKTWERTTEQLSQLVETYYLTYDELPEDLEAMTKGDTPLIEEIPEDPWGNDYIYEIEGERDFTIRSKGEDGEEGTDMDLELD